MQRGRVLLLGITASVMLAIGVVNRATSLWYELLMRDQYAMMRIQYPESNLTSEVIWFTAYALALILVVLYLLRLRGTMAASGEGMSSEHHQELTVIAAGLAIIGLPYAVSGTSSIVDIVRDPYGPDSLLAYHYWAFSFLVIKPFIYLSLAILAWRAYGHERPLLPFCLEKSQVLVLTIVALVILGGRSVRAYGWMRWYIIEGWEFFQSGALMLPSPFWFPVYLSMFLVALVVLLWAWNGMRAEGLGLDRERVHELSIISIALMLLMFPYIIDSTEILTDYIQDWDHYTDTDEVFYGSHVRTIYHVLDDILSFSAFLAIGSIAYWRYRRSPPLETDPLG